MGFALGAGPAPGYMVLGIRYLGLPPEFSVIAAWSIQFQGWI